MLPYLKIYLRSLTMNDLNEIISAIDNLISNKKYQQAVRNVLLYLHSF
jgi:hypothetical protein